MSISKMCSAGTVICCAIYTALNLAAGGEPSLFMALMAVVGVVQYVILE